MLLDSNILIYALDESSPKNLVAQRFIFRNADKLVLTQQIVLETIRTITQKKARSPFTPEEAVLALEQITSAIPVLPPHSKTLFITQELIQKYQLSGHEILDANIVATALTHQIDTIATDNIKHLDKFEEINLLNPFGT